MSCFDSKTPVEITVESQTGPPPPQMANNSYHDFINLGPNFMITTTPDMLSLLHFPKCILSHPNSSISSDPFFHMNFPLQPHQDITSFLRTVEDQIEIDANGGVKSKTFLTERERRLHLNDRFFDLKNLIPNPTKNDRASIVGEAIDYIKELSRTIDEFHILVEKKRIGKFTSKKKDWVKRKSNVTEVDVGIIDDEVTIKLVQKKKINSLFFTTKVLDQFQLEVQHVTGGQFGEQYSFLFNTKICEGSCVYASGIADILMEVMEKQYIEAVSTNFYSLRSKI